MNEDKNNNTKLWITVIVSIIISFSGWLFGVIKSEQAKAADKVEKLVNANQLRLEKQDTRIYAIEGKQEIILLRIENLEERIKELRK
jgi:hypothetical protein